MSPIARLYLLRRKRARLQKALVQHETPQYGGTFALYIGNE
jgi:hypothetical protein